ICFSPDSRFVLLLSPPPTFRGGVPKPEQNGHVEVVSMTNGRVVARFLHPSVPEAAFTPNGDYLVLRRGDDAAPPTTIEWIRTSDWKLVGPAIAVPWSFASGWRVLDNFVICGRDIIKQGGETIGASSLLFRNRADAVELPSPV